MRSIRLVSIALAPAALVLGHGAAAQESTATLPASPPAAVASARTDAGTRLPDASLPPGTVTAVLVRSWGGAFGQVASAWPELDTEWPNYGTIPIAIDTTTLSGSQPVTYAAIAATGADVLILSDSAGGTQQLSATEIEAIGRYAEEGHDVIGTYALFAYATVDNTGLAPLFGLRRGVDPQNTPSISNAFRIVQPTPLFRELGETGWNSNGYAFTQTLERTPAWNAVDHAGARILAECDGFAAIVSVRRTASFAAIYISNMPEYFGGTADKQLLYNAITLHAEAGDDAGDDGWLRALGGIVQNATRATAGPRRDR